MSKGLNFEIHVYFLDIDERSIIKEIRDFTEFFIKVNFEFDDELKKLIYISDIWHVIDKKSFNNAVNLVQMIPMFRHPKFMVPYHKWCGVLDFPIEYPILFGRVCNREMHGGGHYHFGPFEKLKNKFFYEIERLENKYPNLFPYKIIESAFFLDLIQKVKY
ncbi:MAG: hypothetical protein ACFE8N_16145, partial [Promethearchaeota archaeon]